MHISGAVGQSLFLFGPTGAARSYLKKIIAYLNEDLLNSRF